MQTEAPMSVDDYAQSLGYYQWDDLVDARNERPDDQEEGEEVRHLAGPTQYPYVTLDKVTLVTHRSFYLQEDEYFSWLQEQQIPEEPPRKIRFNPLDLPDSIAMYIGDLVVIILTSSSITVEQVRHLEGRNSFISNHIYIRHGDSSDRWPNVFYVTPDWMSLVEYVEKLPYTKLLYMQRKYMEFQRKGFLDDGMDERLQMNQFGPLRSLISSFNKNNQNKRINLQSFRSNVRSYVDLNFSRELNIKKIFYTARDNRLDIRIDCVYPGENPFPFCLVIYVRASGVSLFVSKGSNHTGHSMEPYLSTYTHASLFSAFDHPDYSTFIERVLKFIISKKRTIKKLIGEV